MIIGFIFAIYLIVNLFILSINDNELYRNQRS